MKGGAITTKREKRDAIDKTYSKIELRDVLLTNDDKTMKRTEIRNLTKVIPVYPYIINIFLHFNLYNFIIEFGFQVKFVIIFNFYFKIKFTVNKY